MFKFSTFDFRNLRIWFQHKCIIIHWHIRKMTLVNTLIAYIIIWILTIMVRSTRTSQIEMKYIHCNNCAHFILVHDKMKSICSCFSGFVSADQNRTINNAYMLTYSLQDINVIFLSFQPGPIFDSAIKAKRL